jgi:pimeloyl-ACP methyl ester carboxylesterase
MSILIAAAGAIAAGAALHPVRRMAPFDCPRLADVDCARVSTVATDSTALEGWYFKPRERWNRAAVLLLHGIGDCRASMKGAALFLARNGYGVLTPDLRGHGESGGFCTYGVQETLDVNAWTDWLTENTAVTRVYGLGESLGGSVLIEALPLEPRLRAVVAESPYSSFREVALERTNRATPFWMHWASQPFVAAGLATAEYRYGVDLRTASPVEALRRSRTPVLLIHGMRDRETSPENSVRLQQANPQYAGLWLVPGAGHTGAWSVAGQDFERRVIDWFESH